MREIVLSSTAIGIYQACNWSYYLKYVLGWRPIAEKDHFRIGGHWAKCQELAGLKPRSLCPECAKDRGIDPDCYLCQGTGNVQQDPMQTVLRYLEYSYSDIPSHFNREQWDLEKLKILYSFVGYKWLYPEDEYDIIATEVPFSLPIIDPNTGKKLAKCRLDGVIDQLWRHKKDGHIVIGEQKSTAQSLDNGEYWDHLKVTGQVQTYTYALYMLWVGGALKKFGLKPEEAVIVRPVYDVWKKPSIKPKKLTQGSSKKFVKDGMYCGKEFEVDDGYDPDGVYWVEINRKPAAIEPGAKEGAFAIHETPEMYAERLLHDITERPDFYFGRKEIPVLDVDLQEFANDCVKLVKTIGYVKKENLWIRNARNCKNLGKCDYYDACHSNRNFPCSVEAAPEGFRTTLDTESVNKRKLENE